jgi:MFS family permease
MERFESLKGKALFFLFFLWLLWFLNFTGRTIVSPILPLLEDEFHIAHARASSLAFLISIGYACALFFSGIFSSMFGQKRSIVISLMATAAIYFSMPFVRAFNTLYVLGFFTGLATGIYIPNIIPIITHIYTERVWGKAISFHDSAASTSIFAAPFVALFFLSFVQWRTMYAFLGIAFLAMAIIFALVVEDLKTSGKMQFFQASLVRKPALWLSGTAWVFAAGANLGLYYVIPLYLTKELGIRMDSANTIFGLSRLGGIVVCISLGFFADRFSLKKLNFGLLLVTGLLTMALATKDVRLIKVFMFIQAAVATGFFPISLVAISRMFPIEERGQATGFAVTAGSVFGIGIIPYLLGLSGDLVSFRFGILLLGILTALSSFVLLPMKELK